MGRGEIIETLYNVLDYLQSDDYDETCTYHVELINEVQEAIEKLERGDIK